MTWSSIYLAAVVWTSLCQGLGEMHSHTDKTAVLLFISLPSFGKRASEVAPVVKNLPANTEDINEAGLIPGLGRSPEETGNPLQYSCLENSIDRGASRGTVQGVARS